MNTHHIRETAAHFNEVHDYDIGAALALSSAVIRRAHLVQLARESARDPQLVFPLEEASQ
jgi:hypothetical protein